LWAIPHFFKYCTAGVKKTLFQKKGWQGLLLWGQSHGLGKEDLPDIAALPTV
jgi:hypothetical protein